MKRYLSIIAFIASMSSAVMAVDNCEKFNNDGTETGHALKRSLNVVESYTGTNAEKMASIKEDIHLIACFYEKMCEDIECSLTNDIDG